MLMRPTSAIDTMTPVLNRNIFSKHPHRFQWTNPIL
jgi:hypothetical protein